MPSIKKSVTFFVLVSFLIGSFSLPLFSKEAAPSGTKVKKADAPVSKIPRKRKFLRKKTKVHKKSSIPYSKRDARKRKKQRKSIQAWLKKMKKRISRSHAKHNQLVAVASVRGSKRPEAPPLYWKGKKSKGPVDLPELEEFDGAVNTALNGNTNEAIIKLEKFVESHPKSSLLEDAHHTLAVLKEDPALNP